VSKGGMMKRLLGAHVESSHTVLRYVGGIAQIRAAQMPNRKLSLLFLMFLLLFRQHLKKENSTPSRLLVRVQPHDTTRGVNPVRGLTSYYSFLSCFSPARRVWPPCVSALALFCRFPRRSHEEAQSPISAPYS
jgi:hypothetical protein